MEGCAAALVLLAVFFFTLNHVASKADKAEKLLELERKNR